MNKIKSTILILSLSLGVVSCNDYLDINENPNSAHIENVAPKLIFPGAAVSIHAVQTAGAGSMMELGGTMMNSWALNSYSFTSGFFGREFTLNTVDGSFYSGIWSTIYLQCANFKLIEDYNNSDHAQDNYVAMAKIMKAFYMQYIVDLYGDSPYSEAFMRGFNTTPKYDDDKNIYKALISDLDASIALINSANSNAIAPGGEDVVFTGDMNKWKNFARTIKLRMLLRMSNVTGEMATYRDSKLADFNGTPVTDFNIVNVVVNPGYSNANDDKMNPFVASYRANSAGSTAARYNWITASEHMAIALNGNRVGSVTSYSSLPSDAKFNGIVDPRSSRLFSSVTYQGVAQVKGTRQGALPGEPGAPLDLTTVSKFANATFAGSLPGSTIAQTISSSNTRGGMIMSLAETKFLLAEAALRYPAIFGGDVQANSYFNDAIDASASWLGATIGTYKTTIATRTGLGWTGSFNNKLEAIMTQKWIGLTNVSPVESYIDYLRTGYPFTPMAVTAAVANKPYRLMYPSTETAANSANVPNITSQQLFVKNQYTPFWNQN
ncbi:SusD/RagB family nutrient-binding outer membrane lipoprotein [Chryseobacterium sp. PBS4-4]|uniref:SusD/RagB family nutrient-binding outer membrane lipoprotein n=1 Tax=Chryseobacterium edaphi TaxID=2976532 RepID=A0ABT2W856_9FLAO|nr:SusD/RagB family nutrient-binding outer membrane lipoprotein [Chryseobacterium edaphi]MCU7618158.1 SusD/RagB family nutrient-binding outer membrane lipoprotein [Chryseobacterium edaphi]